MPSVYGKCFFEKDLRCLLARSGLSARALPVSWNLDRRNSPDSHCSRRGRLRSPCLRDRFCLCVGELRPRRGAASFAEPAVRAVADLEDLVRATRPVSVTCAVASDSAGVLGSHHRTHRFHSDLLLAGRTAEPMSRNRLAVFTSLSLATLTLALPACRHESTVSQEPPAPEAKDPAGKAQPTADTGGFVATSSGCAQGGPTRDRIPRRRRASARPSGAKRPAPDAVPMSESCRATLERLEAVRARIPHLFVDLDRSPNQIDADILLAIRTGNEFLTSCAGTEKEAWVKAVVGRNYFSRHARYVEAEKKRVESDLKESEIPAAEAKAEAAEIVKDLSDTYLARIRSLANEAFEAAAPGSEARKIALSLLADMAEKDFDFDKRIRLSKQLLTDFPELAYRQKALLDVGKALFYLTRYEEAAEWMQGVVEKTRERRGVRRLQRAVVRSTQRNRQPRSDGSSHSQDAEGVSGARREGEEFALQGAIRAVDRPERVLARLHSLRARKQSRRREGTSKRRSSRSMPARASLRPRERRSPPFSASRAIFVSSISWAFSTSTRERSRV